MNNDEIDQRLAEAMTEMAALTLECQQLLRVRAQRGAGRRREPAQERPAARAGGSELRVGDCVMVTRRDGYYGRRGRVLGRRGKLYWRVLLQPTEDRVEEEIYKMRHNLMRIVNN